MFSTKATRWFGFLFLLMLALRIGYKHYLSQQPSAAAAHLATAQARSQALMEAIRADQEKQRANGATVVLADSTLAAANTVAPK